MTNKNRKSIIVLKALLSGSEVMLKGPNGEFCYRYFEVGETFDSGEDTYAVTEPGLFIKSELNGHDFWVNVFDQELSRIVNLANAQDDEMIIGISLMNTLNRFKNR